MEIEFDQAKRDKTLAERDLDFAQAAAIFAGHHFTAKTAGRAIASHAMSQLVY